MKMFFPKQRFSHKIKRNKIPDSANVPFWRGEDRAENIIIEFLRNKFVITLLQTLLKLITIRNKFVITL